MSRLKTIFLCILLIALTGKGQAQTLTVDDFIGEPELLDMDISPNGHYLAEIRQNNGTYQVYIRDLTASGSIIGTIGGSTNRPHRVIWANDERLIVHMKVPYFSSQTKQKLEEDPDFDMKSRPKYNRFVSVDIKGNNPVLLMQQLGKSRWKVDFSYLRHIMPGDPKHILITSYAGDRLALFKVNVYDGSTERIALGGPRTFYFICDSEGNPKYRTDYLSSGKGLSIFQLAADKTWSAIDQIEFDLSDESSPIDPEGLAGISPKGHLLFRKRNPVTGYFEIHERSSSAKQSSVIATHPNKNIADLLYSTRDDQVIGYRIEDDVFINRYFDAALQQQDDDIRQKLGGYGFHFISSDNKTNRSIIGAYGPNLPGAYFLYEQEKKQLGFYGYEYPRLEQEKLATPIITNYRTRDGATVRMYLLLPPSYQANKQYPLVVMPHGGPHTRDYAFYDNFAAFIATRGYIVARPNFRGSTGYGLKFEAAGHREWGGIMQDDLQDAAQHLIDKNYAIAGRICLVGGSYGGYAALMGLVKHSGFYRCAASINGVTHLRDQIKHNENRFKDYPEIVASLHKRIGNPKTDSSQLDHNSPALQANKIAAPVLIIAGTKDGVVPYKQSKRMVAALKSKKKEVEWLSLKDAYHNPFFLDKDKRAIYSRIDAFLAKHLQQPEKIP